MTLGKKIAAARKELGREWTQQRLAEALKAAGSTHTRAWVAGVETDRIPPHADDVKVLAKVLKKPVEFFSAPSSVGFGYVARHGGEGLESLREPPSGVDMTTMAQLETTAPVLGIVCAERFAFSFESVPGDHIPNPWPRKKVFALQISGDCMEPTFRNGEFVYLSESQQVVDGKVVLAQLDGEYTLKRYFRRADYVELKPDNGKYKSIKIATNKLIIKGVVVGTYRKDI